MCRQGAPELCLRSMHRHASVRPFPHSQPARWLAALGVLLLASGAMGQTTTTYRWVDAQGVVHYSDTPHPGATVIQLQSAQTYQAPSAAAIKAARAGASSTPSSTNTPAAYQSCGIGQPAADASLFAPDAVAVTVALSPALRDGDQLFVTVDGTALAPTTPGALTYQLENPDRGAHNVVAVVRDTDGRTVCHAETTFNVQRPSVNSPASPVRPH